MTGGSSVEGAGMATTNQPSARVAHVLSLMKKGDDAFNRQVIAAMNAGRHPDMIAHVMGSDKPTYGRAAHAAVQQSTFRAFPNVRLHLDPYPIQFGDGDGSVKNLGLYAASGIAWWPKRPSSTAALT